MDAETIDVPETKTRRPRLTKAVARGIRAMIEATGSIDNPDLDAAADWLHARLGERGLE